MEGPPVRGQSFARQRLDRVVEVQQTSEQGQTVYKKCKMTKGLEMHGPRSIKKKHSLMFKLKW